MRFFFKSADNFQNILLIYYIYYAYEIFSSQLITIYIYMRVCVYC